MSSLKLSFCGVTAALLLVGCAQEPLTRASEPSTVASSAAFAPSNDPANKNWQDVVIRFKTPTKYSRAEVEGQPCVLAEANGSWSLHVAAVPPQFAGASTLAWRWHIPALVAGADNSLPGSDDSAARLVVAFKGDRDKLDASDRATMSLAKALGGHVLPFAAIQYIWETKAPINTVIPNANISRIKKVVVRSGEKGLAQWQSFERNVREDFRKAFPGEEPGEIESLGLMTDTDSLGGVTRACYADLALR